MSLFKCPECGNEISTKAATCPQCGAKRPSNKIGFCTILVSLILLSVIIGSFSSSKNGSSGTAASTAQPHSSIGSEVALTVSSGDVPVCPTLSAYDEFIKLALAHDTLGMAQMAIAGRLILVPPGTRALVIDSGFERREVRILSGENVGKSGWVTNTFITTPSSPQIESPAASKALVAKMALSDKRVAARERAAARCFAKPVGEPQVQCTAELAACINANTSDNVKIICLNKVR